MGKDPLPRLEAIRDQQRQLRAESDHLIPKAVRIHSQRRVARATGRSQSYISKLVNL